MMRLGAIFVAVCMVIIAGSAGAIVYFYLGVGASEAATVGVATLTALALYNTVSTRIGMRTAVARQLADLSRGVAELARQVAEMGRRLPAVESKADNAVDRAREVTDPLAAEIGELGTLVKQLAETVAAHQTAIDTLARAPAAAPAPISAAPAAPPGVLAAEAPAQLLAAAQTPSPAEALPPLQPEAEPKAGHPAPTLVAIPEPRTPELEAKLATIRAAVEANRVDLYLQPIVTLPQRKVRYYEAMSRL